MKYKYLVVVYLLFLTACLSSGISEKTPKVLILYDTCYGSTELVAHWIGEGLDEKTKILNIENTSGIDYGKYSFILLGGPIYKGDITEEMQRFINTNREKLQNKPIGIFVVCGMHLVYGDRWLDKFEHELKDKPAIKKAFGGRLIPDKLNQADRERLIDYWAQRGVPEIKGFNYLSEEEAIEFGRIISVKIFHQTKIMHDEYNSNTINNTYLLEKTLAENARNECYVMAKESSPNTLNMAEYEKLIAEQELKKGNIEKAKLHFNSANKLYYKAKAETLFFQNKKINDIYEHSLIPVH